MISYCVPIFRPWFAKRLILDLIRKTSAPFEILLWLNVNDAEFDAFLAEQIAAGHPVKVVGKTPENIGMSAFGALFEEARYEMITQIDDDVICVSPRIAEICSEIFAKHPIVKQVAANVWQDELTCGARPAGDRYKIFDVELGLYNGPIDGWFSVYHRSILPLVLKLANQRKSLRVSWKPPFFQLRRYQPGKYFYLGSGVQGRLERFGKVGLLCTRCKVFHVTEPDYLSYFNGLDFEIKKYRALGRNDVADSYERRSARPAPESLADRVRQIELSLSSVPSDDIQA